MKTLINVKNLGFSYSDKEILRDISFDLKQGEILGIIGPNGGGKSTLLKILGGIYESSSGDIEIHGKTAHVPQFTELNSLIPLRVIDLINLEADFSETLIDQTLKSLGLEDKKNALMSTLSGGERQRAIMAKAVITQPDILILDEPLTALDGLGQDQVLKVLKSLKAKNIAQIIVDHNLPLLMAHCDKALCLNHTSHWHDKKELLTQNVLEDIYHCEFEHLLLHQKEGLSEEHTHCDHHESHEHHEDDK